MTQTLNHKHSVFSVGIGIMSGTSLDGIDLAICHFPDTHSFELKHFKTIAYPKRWKQRLETAHTLSGLELRKLELEYSEFTAKCVLEFLHTTAENVDFIACHGHTVFHQPDEKLTLQILDGSVLANLTGITTVCDFRSGDMALGGQGAPLVPIGDALLFGQYEACLNLGGFANVSYEHNSERIAYDISPANLILNDLAQRENKEYDKGGIMARSGNIIPQLLKEMDSLPFYAAPFPKSLGREWMEKNISSLLKNRNTQDSLATCVEHISNQIAIALNRIAKSGKVLVTGGGAHNTFLMERISHKTRLDLTIPASDIIDAKEAIVFAFLGKLRLDEKANTLASVTGASRNTIGGAVYHGN